MDQDNGERQTVIDEGTGFKGDFNSDCPIVVKGRIEGKMTAPSLTVEATGSVLGVVKVKELRSEGVIAGEYDADYVKLSGVVKDDTIIRAKTLEVSLSPQRGRMQVTFGACELEVGDTPDKSAAIAAAEAGEPAVATVAPIEARTEALQEPTVDAIVEAAAEALDALAPPEEAASSDPEPSEGKRGRREGRRSTSPPPTR